MERRLRLVLVDDHQMVREALSACLAQEPDFEVVGTAEDGTMAVGLCSDLDPDVVVLDVDLPGLSAFETGRTILDKTHARIIFLSGFSHDSYIEAAVDCGASGYVLKEDGVTALIRAIRESETGWAFSERIRDRLVFEEAKTPVFRDRPRSRASLLTPGQVELLRYLAKGLSKKEIASLTGRSYSAVDKQVTRVMDKLSIHDRVELSRFAIREGIAEA